MLSVAYKQFALEKIILENFKIVNLDSIWLYNVISIKRQIKKTRRDSTDNLQQYMITFYDYLFPATSLIDKQPGLLCISEILQQISILHSAHTFLSTKPAKVNFSK